MVEQTKVEENEGRKLGIWASLLDENYRERVKVVLSALGLGATVAAATGLFLSYQDSIADRAIVREQLIISERRLISEQYATAAELLSKDKRTIRVAAIYSLENVATNSEQDHWKVMELLSADIRLKSLAKVEEGKIASDIQAAISVIGRRKVEQDPKGKRINLEDSNLSYLDLSNLNLSGNNLRGTNLNHADLNNAILLSTDLRETNNLNEAQLMGEEHPLICNSPLPQKIRIDSDRDCDKMAAALQKSIPGTFPSLKEADKFVNEQRKKKWD